MALSPNLAALLDRAAAPNDPLDALRPAAGPQPVYRPGQSRNGAVADMTEAIAEMTDDVAVLRDAAAHLLTLRGADDETDLNGAGPGVEEQVGVIERMADDLDSHLSTLTTIRDLLEDAL